MLLEAGLNRKDDSKAVRRNFGTANRQSNGISYEQWVKLISCGFFTVWLTFLVVYTSIINPRSINEERDTYRVINAEVKNNPVHTNKEETNLIVIGDYGTGTESQVQVAETLKNFVSNLSPKASFILSTGDQIYDHGITSADDPLVVSRFEQMYAHPDLNIPWYITIGNHDCEGSIDAMLDYAKRPNSLWHFPRRYYSVDRMVAPKTLLRMIFIDACDLVCGTEPRNFRCNGNMNKQSSEKTRKEQYQWIDEALSASQPRGVDKVWKIVVGHWAVYSYAGNADTQELIDNLDPLLRKHRVHAYFNGHDHCMQHIRKHDHQWAMNYFVSGAGGYGVHELQENARANSDLFHAAMTNGFMWARVSEDSFQIQFIDWKGDVLYTTELQYD